MVSKMSSNFGQTGPSIMELSSLERLKYPHILMTKKTVSPLLLGCFYPIFLLLAGNEKIIKSLNEFEFRLDLTTYYRFSCLERLKN